MTAITGAAGAAKQPPTPSKANASMDQNDFLRLMTAQLSMQDPFNPVDNQQMVAQMAQFSQVSGIAEMNKSLKSIAEGFTPGRLTDAASWIGRDILAGSDIAPPLADGSYRGEVALKETADHVTVNFVDETGAVVHSKYLGSQQAGALPFTWDGKNAQGEAIPGPLQVVVTANKRGEAVASAVAVWTKITGIQSPASGGPTQLLTGLGVLSPDDAIRLS